MEYTSHHDTFVLHCVEVYLWVSERVLVGHQRPVNLSLTLIGQGVFLLAKKYWNLETTDLRISNSSAYLLSQS